MIRAAFALVVLTLALAGCGRSAPASCDELPGDAVRILDSPHIPHIDAEHEEYASKPATSGPHLPWTIAPGVYREPVRPELQVHALEHGHVIVQYGSGVSAVDIEELEAVTRRHVRDVIVAPSPDLGRGVALTAWARLERLDRVDGPRVERFIKLLAGRYEHGWRGGAEACGA